MSAQAITVEVDGALTEDAIAGLMIDAHRSSLDVLVVSGQDTSELAARRIAQSEESMLFYGAAIEVDHGLPAGTWRAVLS